MVSGHSPASVQLEDTARPAVVPDLEEASTSGADIDGGFTHFFCVSPDAPTNPVLYWLGGFDSEQTRFKLESARGPLRLDLGDVLYAPNLMVDAEVQPSNPWTIPG